MNTSSRRRKLNTVAVKLGCSRRSLFRLWSKKPHKKQQGTKATVEDDGCWIAVEKVSEDPYLDFRDSMLRMVMEKKMYAEDDLREILGCFLRLNSEEFHEIIFRAFGEVLDWCVHLE